MVNRSLCLFILLTALLTGSNAQANLGVIPDLSQIQQMQGAVDTASSIGDMAQGAMAIGSLAVGGGGVMGITAINQAVGNTQRDPWTILDEFYYSWQNDLVNIPQLLDCIEYSIVGSCLSVRWTFWGPKFTFGLAVEHFVRDTHVEVVAQAPSIEPLEFVEKSVYPSSSGIAEDMFIMYPYTWKFSRYSGSGLIGMIGRGIDSLLENTPGATSQSQENRFLYRDVQVSGNVEKGMHTSIASGFLGWAGYCNVPTAGGAVYYNSTLDLFSWRWLATSEVVLTALYQAHHLSWNDIGNNYGSTMPRSGYINTPNPFKASVVAAIRGTSIAAENRAQYSGVVGLHVYVPLPQYGAGSFTGGQYRTPQDAQSFKMDMVYPYKQKRCTRYEGGAGRYVFDPAQATLDDVRTAKFNNNNPHGSAIFKLYRPFRCCKKNGSKVYSVVSPGPIGKPR
ncbi:TraU family protein [Vibrio sp. THAF190c]|uniref:TraU family protein n=1 Tax=Vibrio sp. THAF190c TaxID=2587865 RepID=UPI0012693702|nr:TraU family protein [Vibrio sp. THAF190c]QFT13414.1 TraU protein [Vibrio sp. THAF190c]